MARKKLNIDLKRKQEAEPSDLEELFGGDGGKDRPERADRMRLSSIPLDQIEADPDQPRKQFSEESLAELRDSIILEGVIQPIEVIQTARNKYRIVHGERRWRASKLAKKESIPAIVRRRDYDEVTRFVRQMVENVQREGLNDVDRALAMVRLRELMAEEMSAAAEIGIGPWSNIATWSKVGERLGMSRQRVGQLKRLLVLPPIIQEAVRGQKISERDTRIFQNLDKDQQINLHIARDVDQIISKAEAKRVAEYLKLHPHDLVDRAILQIRKEPSRVSGASKQVQAIEKALTDFKPEKIKKKESADLRNRLEKLQNRLQTILDQIDSAEK